MPRRRLSLVIDVLLVVLGVLLSLVVDYLANTGGVTAPAVRLLQRWAVPLLLVALVLIIGVQVWQYLLERPPSPVRAWDSDRPPYPGLESFVEQDAGMFFGREPQITELLDRLHPTLPDQAHRFVAVIGPSGAGKSSLVRAGLLPRLAQRRSRWAIAPPLTPGEQPAAGLAACLQEVPAADRSAPVLLVIDQAEELLTRCGQEEREAFVQLLTEALRDNPRLWVVATVRSEFLTGLLTSGFAELFRNPVVIGSLERAALFRVIERPAAQAGLTFAPGVVNELVDDTGGGDALPLLAYTLQALYLRVGSGGTVTAEDCRALGGVAGALSLQADKVAAELGGDVPVLDTLLRFVTVEGSEPTRRRVRRASLSDAERLVVDAFVTARLLTSDADGDDAVIDVAHEALFRQWPPLRQAIEARADDLRQRAELERWAADWARSDRRDSYLLRDERLQIAQQWAATNGDLATELPLVHEFLDRSARSDRAALVRLSESVARQALASVDQDPELAVLLALAAVEECTPTPVARQALLAATVATRVRRTLCGHDDRVRDVAWSPDGRLIATASGDHTARIWDAESGAELAVLRGHEDWVEGVAWSPDGLRIATASSDHTARIWDARTSQELTRLRGHGDWVEVASWSPDGRRIATASGDGTARVWDATLGTVLIELHGHDQQVRSVTWSPDGQRLATASSDHTARIWDAQTGIQRMVLYGHADGVRDVDWSPDGQRIATASHDRSARIWDAHAGTELAVLRGHEQQVRRVAWSPDGKHLGTTSKDRTTRIWDAQAGTDLVVLRGHTNLVEAVTWSPDGKHLATASDDRTVWVWDTHVGTDLVALWGHTEWLEGLAWSPDGQRLATASGDRTVHIWDTQLGTDLVALCGHAGWIAGVAWSSNGQRIATAAYDRTARVWDAEAGVELRVLRGHTNRVGCVAWAPDGQHLATASFDRTARIWDTETGVELTALLGHGSTVRAVAWSPDGHHIATASSDRTVRVWSKAGIEVTVVRGHEDVVQDVTWSPDGRRLATSSYDRTARVWDANNGRELAVLRGHEDEVTSVSWSSDGRRIATASADGTARVWDAETGVELAIVGVHADWVQGVAWSPDGQRIATASRDRTARIWDADTDLEALVAKARGRVFRSLTDEERRSAMLPSSS